MHKTKTPSPQPSPPEDVGRGGRNLRSLRPFRRSDGGHTLIEILVVMAIVAIMAVMITPNFFEMAGKLRVSLAAQGMAGTLRSARLYAIRYSTNVAVKFHTEDDPMTYAVYRDGDGDGVRNSDIKDGTDPVVWPRRSLCAMAGNIYFGFPPGQRPRHPGNPRRQKVQRHQ